MKVFSLSLILLTFLCAGCVGTVQDSQQPFSKISDPPETPLSFAGVTQANSISDSRIEVFFYPAIGGSGKYTYDIIVGSDPYPISLPSDTLMTDYKGMLKYTLRGLSRLSTYQVKVEVRDNSTNVQSKSEVSKTVVTFDNMVADFIGISTASNMPGQDGKDSIKIRWTPAKSSGALTAADSDPLSYEIVLVDASKLAVTDMDITTLTPTQGRWVFNINNNDTVNEYIVRGLPAKTKFYARMRCLHQKSEDDVYNPKKRSELNTNYVTISTLSADLADINFQPASFAVALAAGEQGLSAVQTSWTAATGVIDHYRLYYSEAGGGVANGLIPSLCLSPLLSATNATVFCKKASYTSNNSPITGLRPYTDYEVRLVLCATTTCAEGERITGDIRTIKTDPNNPTFNGINDILMAQNLNEVGNLNIKFDPPSFAAGYFDGLILEVRRTLDESGPVVEVTSTTSPYNITYNFLTQNQIIVKGVNYLELEPYCFTLYPYKWSADGHDRNLNPPTSGKIWKCVQPKPEAPTSQQFAGLSNGTSDKDAISLTWNASTSGMFSHYELFWRKQSGQTFNWGDAIGQAGNSFNYTNYGRMLIDPDATNVVLNGFGDGNYNFGIITYYTYVTDAGVVVMRSETNGNLKNCVINNTATSPIDCN